MKIDVIVTEIGSTTTVVNAFSNINSPNPIFIGQGQGPTTVLEGDVTKGLEIALKNLAKNLGEERIDYNQMYATSSAAGGLKMTVHGLVYDMTVRAAKEAALGAGAVIKGITAGLLKDEDLDDIIKINPNIVMLAGGVDYGEENIIYENAKKLASVPLEVPLIYGGNVKIAKRVEELFKSHGKDIVLIENVYPKIDELNVGPARDVIQRVFEEHITKGPGMEKIRQLVTGTIIPTPGAVMKAAMVLQREIGDLMVIDVGGATTDVHSVTDGSEEMNKYLISPEPREKRTVEGDLGVFINSENIINLVGQEKFAQRLGIFEQEINNFIKPIPQTQKERDVSKAMTQMAVETAVNRHVGKIKLLYGPTGRYKIVEGKDLTQVRWIIGTGGALTRLDGGLEMLENVKRNLKGDLLLPKDNAKPLLDHDYNMGVLGAMAVNFPRESVSLMRKSLNV
ncbi:glutamate mutase L [Alkalicella caledoniensis]|uniref:Glutamate mutase L n=1 Tax=Alkalicella caledoniensis TaxID=2731377 RepID=A0A7G9W7S9_ALKCA|nr:GlmL-related ornithine degradation protein [Alkalicella caledoniensis]QNO14741.1 glutamate mutase L [Alkalicella caledoniensis]